MKRSTIVRIIVPTAPRGNAALDALRREEDAERPERHDDAERRTIVEISISTQNFSTIVRAIVPYALV